DDKCLLIWGDIVHYPHIQSAQPAVSILFDTDPAQAEETRKKIMEKAVSEKLIIAGMHLSQAGFASVFREGSGYRISYSEK
ncbi:MBL fold metallo-hydrolase, partial [Lelliottia amnigena]|nr:MBL fold metallo-hydrolase [Lelliottia amnigena]